MVACINHMRQQSSFQRRFETDTACRSHYRMRITDILTNKPELFIRQTVCLRSKVQKITLRLHEI